MSKKEKYDTLNIWIIARRLSHSLQKGGDAMYVTYSDLIQFGMLMIAIIALLENRNR